jgi:holo-[acyl-carrier protein] synthase
MFVLRSGVDLLEISRLGQVQAEIKPRFLTRVFTPRELEICKDSDIHLSGRFAAKEAVAKALGSGIGPVSWQEIEILQGGAGEPLLVLHGKALDLSNQLGLHTWSLSISHTASHAVAFAVAVGDAGQAEAGAAESQAVR